MNSKSDVLKLIADAAAAVLDLPNGRDRACVLTKLDEATMWCQRIIEPVDQKPAE